MKIKVRLIGPLVYEAGFSEKEIEAPEGITVDALFDLITIPKERPKIVVRNGLAIAPQDVLLDGDKIAISPIYSGG